MIRIYDRNEKEFNHNGIGILKDVITCTCKEVLNGKYDLEFEYKVDGQFNEYLVEENIVKAPVGNPSGDDQLFRIKIVSKQLKRIKVYATHIFYDLNDNFLEDVAPTNKSGDGAIKWMIERTAYKNDFTASSNITKITSARYVRRNFVEALIGSDNAFINTWGGELYRNNKSFSMNANKGMDRGVQIRYGKNMKEITWDIDITGIVTRIYPVGFDGLTLPELFIDSPLINNYIHPIIQKLEFTDIRVDEENGVTLDMALNQLRAEVQNKYDQGIDRPVITIQVDFLELSKTDEYKNLYKSMEKIYLGDYVTAVVPHLNLNEKLKVVSTTYDVLAEKYIEFELSNTDTRKRNFINNTNELIKKLEQVDMTVLNAAKEGVTSQIVNALGGYVYKTRNELFIMDNENPNEALKVWRWNIEGLGYSSTGIAGPYGIAITADGQIVADFITTGKINTNLIEGYGELQLSVSNVKTEVNTIKTATESNTTKIGNVETGLNSATTNITNLSKSIDDASKKLNSVESNLNTTNTNVSNLSETLESTSSKVSSVESGLATTNTNVGNLQTSLNTTNSNVTSVQNSLKTTNTNVTNVQNSLKTTNTNVSNLQTSLNTTNTNVGNLSDSLEETNNKVSSVESSLETTNTNVGNLQTGLNTTNTNVTNVQNSLKTTNTNVTNVQNSLKTTNTNVTNLQTGLNTTNTNVSNLTSSLDTTNTNVSNLTTSLNTTNTNVSNLSTKVDTASSNASSALSKANTNAKSITTINTNVSALQLADTEIRTSVENVTTYIDNQIDAVTTAQEAKNAEIDLRADAIATTVSSVSELTTSTSNNLKDLSNKLNDYTPSTKTATLEQNLTTLQTNTYTKTEINTKLTDGSVTKVQTVSGTFDENGMHYSKTNAPTSTTINEVGVGTTKGNTAEYVLFAGYVNDSNKQYEKYKGQTLVASENMLVSNYLVIGEKSRMENYENGTGIFTL